MSTAFYAQQLTLFCGQLGPDFMVNTSRSPSIVKRSEFPRTRKMKRSFRCHGCRLNVTLIRI